MKVWPGPSGDVSGANPKTKIRVRTVKNPMELIDSVNAGKLGLNAARTVPTMRYSTRGDEGKFLAPPSYIANC